MSLKCHLLMHHCAPLQEPFKQDCVRKLFERALLYMQTQFVVPAGCGSCSKAAASKCMRSSAEGQGSCCQQEHAVSAEARQQGGAAPGACPSHLLSSAFDFTFMLSSPHTICFLCLCPCQLSSQHHSSKSHLDGLVKSSAIIQHVMPSVRPLVNAQWQLCRLT